MNRQSRWKLTGKPMTIGMAALLVVLSLATGCGGGGGGGTTANAPSAPPNGSLTLQLGFAPATGRGVRDANGLPAATQSLVVHLEDPSTGRDVVPPTTVPRVQDSTSQSVTITAPAGATYLVVVVALDASGNALGFFNDSVTLSAGDTTVTVSSSVTLTSLEISPSGAAIAAGSRRPFVATAAFSDQSTNNITSAVTWNSSDQGIATISNEAGSNGAATGVAAGSTTITATLDGRTAPARLIVVATPAPPGSTGLLPGPPQAVTASIAGLPARHVALSWAPPATDGGSPITGYWVSFSTSSGAWGGGFGTTADQTSYEFTSLPPGDTLSFSVAAMNGVGSGLAAAGNSVVVPQDSGALPGAPRNVLATVAGLPARHVVLSWAPPATDGGSPITGYWVSFSTSSGTWGGGFGTNADQTSYEFTSLPPGDTLSFSVQAMNGVGTGPATAGNSVVVP